MTKHLKYDTISIQNRGSALGEGKPSTARLPSGSIPLLLPLLSGLRLSRLVVCGYTGSSPVPRENFFKIVLDKSSQVCYNKFVRWGTPTAKDDQKIVETDTISLANATASSDGLDFNSRDWGRNKSIEVYE